MTSEKTMNNIRQQALVNEDLAEVTGGAHFAEVKSTGKYYESDAPVNQLFLCPKCHRPVHTGTFGRYYCDPCDKSYGSTDSLVPNLDSGLWREISVGEYHSKTFVPFFII